MRAAMPAGEGRLLRMAASLSLLMLAAGCGLCGSTELSRTASDAGDVEAVVIERSCGATTGFNYRVHVVPKGAPAEERDMVFLADKVENLKVTWQGGDQLLITYDQAKIFFFRNFSTVYDRKISIVERSTDDYHHLPLSCPE